VNCECTAPFETIESAQEYLKLLSAMVGETQGVVEDDIQTHSDGAALRQVDALKLILYKLERLSDHLQRSHRILNDLRILRRLLQKERSKVAA
jgi:hypothetical protein